MATSGYLVNWSGLGLLFFLWRSPLELADLSRPVSSPLPSKAVVVLVDVEGAIT